MIPERDTRTPLVTAAKYEGIWQPMHVFHKNESIQVFETLSAHWLDLVASSRPYTPRKWRKFESTLVLFEGYATEKTVQLPSVADIVWVEPSNILTLLVWPTNHFGDVYPQKIVIIGPITIHFDHFWRLCDGQYCAVGLLWGLKIESSPPNIFMLLV